jgi:hypothetical protein
VVAVEEKSEDWQGCQGEAHGPGRGECWGWLRG